MKRYLFVANWKMAWSVQESVDFVCTWHKGLEALADKTGHDIVICPSYPALWPIGNLIKDSHIQLGSQDCSFFGYGPYTGQVCPESLVPLGCTYCIIGHSERRRYCSESNDAICQKTRHSLEAGLEPIICVGETDDRQHVATTLALIYRQLHGLKKHFAHPCFTKKSLCIAYEPVWAIGSGRTPDLHYLHLVFEGIVSVSKKIIPDDIQIHYLYGGSVNEKNIVDFSTIDHVTGFLVGGTSLDFQKFKNMISLCR
jgi:triosephosphate isomerase (TIM)